MKRYEMIGRPIGAPFQVLESRAIGDVFEDEVDPDVERLLVGAGALRVLNASVKRKEEKTETPKPAPRETPDASTEATEPERKPEPNPERSPEPKPERSPEPKLAKQPDKPAQARRR